MQRPISVIITLLIISIASVVVALSVGSYTLSPDQLWMTLTGNGTPLEHTIVWELRAPRAYTAFITGALLSLAGALMQVLLRNPLAEPYILGVSGGASVLALLAMSAGLSTFWVSGSAFVGALISIVIVFGLSHASGNWNPSRLLLTGVVIAAGWAAVINFILSVSPEKPLRGMLFWLMGDLSHVTATPLGFAVLLVALIITFALARPLNILARGELQAQSLGIEVKPLRISLFLLSSLLTGVAVTMAGSVGFIGLVVPHMLRLVVGSDHRILLPTSVLAGGSLLMLSDVIARTLIAPQQLPVGVVTAIIGVPFFLYLLNRNYATRATQ